MEVSKLKNIVIIVLALLNLCLLALSGGRRMQDVRSREQARASAIEVIRAGGVSIDEVAVPKEMNLLPMVAQRDLKEEALQAGNLLGGEVTVEARGGEVYRYTNAAGWLQVHGTGQYSAQMTGGEALTEQERPEDHAAKLLERLGIQSRAVTNNVAKGQGEVVLDQMLNGAALLDCRVTVRYQDGFAVQISGNRRLPGRTEQVEYAPIAVSTALMRLYNGLNDMGDVYSAIRSITPAYLLSAEGGGSVRLTPVWQVETDTGVYRLDTITGGLSRTGEHPR
ncbi:MAG: hypothetical protein IJB75_00670 [Oscillospiraceae bacterium]|nr:hypothetical protein [Oscillospiraceae bacterium]